jgi:hypothetical protein
LNGNHVSVTSTLAGTGDLSVSLTGAANMFQPRYGDFLPPNNETNDPAGKGYVQFTLKTQKGLAPNTVIHQGADVVFNGYANGGSHTPTNIWDTAVTLPAGPPLSVTAKTSRLTPQRATLRWRPPRNTTSKPSGSVTSYTTSWARYERDALTRKWSKVPGTDGSTPMLTSAQLTPVGPLLTYAMTLPAGSYQFTVTAHNALGAGPASKLSSRKVVY